MKHGTPDSMKFRKLQRRLGLPRYVVIGVLEALWIATQKNAPRGNIGIFTNEEIAIELDWEGDPDELVNTLVDTGWIDQSDEFRLLIHDWESHAPRYVHGVVSKIGGFAQSLTTVPDCSPPLQCPTVEANEGDCSDQLAGARLNLTTPHLTQPNPTTPQKGRSGVGGVLTNLKAEDLRNPAKLLAVVESNPRFSSEHGRLQVLAASLRALDNGKNPGALFRSLIEGDPAKFAELIEPYMQEASRLLREIRGRKPPPHVAALVPSFKGDSS